jgi:Passenger-associated-transport-repeat
LTTPANLIRIFSLLYSKIHDLFAKTLAWGSVAMSWKLAGENFSSSFLYVAAFLLSATVVQCPSTAKAVDKNWNVTNGDWSDTAPFPWATSPEPVADDRVYINNGGTANITQSGEVCNELILGNSSSNVGTIRMTGGSLSANRSEALGQSGRGTFIQSNGTNTITDGLWLGYYSGSNGSYNLSDAGQLSAANEYIGYSGQGTFTQTGGTNTAKYMRLGPNGTYLLSGGTMNINGGFENHGTWNLTHNSATINISSSIINISSGTIIGSGNASLNLDVNSLLIAPSGFNPLNYFAGYTNNGIFHEIGSELVILPSKSIYGAGEILDHVNCQGTLAATSGCSMQLQTGLNISGTGIVNLGMAGWLDVEDTVSGMSGGSLNTYYHRVGYSGTGTFTQTGGTNYSSILSLGEHSGSSGRYDLSGAGQLSGGNANIGSSGIGAFTQTGGTNSIQSISLGVYSGAIGSYELSGTGQSSTLNEYVGFSGRGTFTQTGGTNSITYDLYIGYNTYSSSNIYNLSGTGQLSATNEYIGYSGTGTFTQIDATNTIADCLYLGYNSGSGGSYSLSGTGQLSASIERIGNNGAGTFTQTGGTNTISSSLYVGSPSSSACTYDLSATGQLCAKSESIGFGGRAVLTQTGGTNTSEYIKICPQGKYILSNGTINLNGGLVNQGTLDLSNSSAVINASSSIIDISTAILVNAKNLSLNIDGPSLLIVPSGFDPASYFTNYTNYGLVHQVGSVLDIISTTIISGSGSIQDHVNCQGTLTATFGIDLNNGINISNAGNVNLSNGFLYVNDSISGMNGGSLIASSLRVGDTATGTFTHTGGTNTITANNLTLGSYGSSGTYNLSDTGQLFAGNEYIGSSGTGVFNQTGGTNTISLGLYLGTFSGSNGTYCLNGGKLILKSLNKGSNAAFNFGGGTLQASDNFTTSMPMTLTGATGNANVDTAGYSVTLSGVLSGIGGLNKLGSGALTLNSKETFSGNTTVQDGTLIISGGIGASGTSLIDIQSGNASLKTIAVNKTSLNINTAALATFEVVNGAHTVGVISGNGTTQVDSGANLTAASISQGTLTIASGATVTIQAIPGGPQGGAITPVPEPSTLILLGSVFILAAILRVKQSRR